MATQFRPTTLYLPISLIVLWILYRTAIRRRILVKQVLIFLLFFSVLLVPFLYRNFKVFGVWEFSSVKTQVLYSALAPSILLVKYGGDYNTTQDHFFEAQGLVTFPDIMLDKTGWYEERALAVIKENKSHFLLTSAVILGTFFTHDGTLEVLGWLGLSSVYKNLPHLRQIVHLTLTQILNLFWIMCQTPAILILIFRVLWCVVTIFFFLSIFYQLFILKKISTLFAFIVFLVFYFALTTISNGLVVNSRFRFPVNSLILIMVAQGINDYFQNNFFKNKNI